MMYRLLFLSKNIYNPRNNHLNKKENAPNIFHSIGMVSNSIPVKFQSKQRILKRGILSYNRCTAQSKSLQKCHYPLKLRTTLKPILERILYRSQKFTNGRKGRETPRICTNQGSLSPRKVIIDTVGCPECVCNDFWLRSGWA